MRLLVSFLAVLVHSGGRGRVEAARRWPSCHYDNTTSPLQQIPEDERSESQSQPGQGRGIGTVRRNVARVNQTSCLTTAYQHLLQNVWQSQPGSCRKDKPTVTKEDELRRKQDQEIIKLLNEKEAEGWKKNFAGDECGAKLIKSSPSLKHPQHLINKNQDEYMMTECKDETFFIIELCETIKVMRFEMDNFELYSGTPRNFTVRTVDKYSNNIKDWVVIGNFEASSAKMEIQNFSDLELKVFGKFIRVDIKSHHGTEHFCTMTSFRVFGVSEYEFLHIIDSQAEDTDGTNEQQVEQDLVDSQVENRLNQLMMKRPGHGPESRGYTTTLTYKYLFLQMYTDVCVDSVTIESLTQSGSVTSKNGEKSIKYKSREETVSKSRMDVKAIGTDGLGEDARKEQGIVKAEDTNASNTILAPKESILVQISNRVKFLEKNLTAQNNVLKTFNSSSKQQGNDIGKILETIVKAKEVFEETASETEHVKGKVMNMDQKVNRIEHVLAESKETMKMMMAITIVLAITCLFLISIICFRDSSPNYGQYEAKTELEDDKPVDNTFEMPSSTSTILKNLDGDRGDESPQQVKKKVTFSEEEIEKSADSGEDDISWRMESPQRRMRMKRKDPLRRATWCGGSLRKLAEDAAALVAKEF